MTDISKMAEVIAMQEDLIQDLRKQLFDLQQAKFTVREVRRYLSADDNFEVMRISDVIPTRDGVVVYVS